MTPTTGCTVVALFEGQEEAAAAIGELRQAGFNDAELGVAARGRGHGPPTSGQGPSGPPTAGTGAAVGLVVGAAIAGFALGNVPGALGGGLAALLGGALTGGLIGALIDLGIPEQDARFYNDEVRAGGILVTVRAGDRCQEAADLLRTNGGRHVRVPPAR